MFLRFIREFCVFCVLHEQSYQIVDVMLLGEETVDIYTQHATAAHNCSCQPRFATTLNRLLQSLLQTVQIQNCFGYKAKTTHGGFDFAHALEVREMTAARLVDRLCDEGYLERRDNPRHHRAYCVHLTSAATPLLGKLDEIAKTHEAATFAGFETEDLEKLDSMLDLIAHNLAEL